MKQITSHQQLFMNSKLQHVGPNTLHLKIINLLLQLHEIIGIIHGIDVSSKNVF